MELVLIYTLGIIAIILSFRASYYRSKAKEIEYQYRRHMRSHLDDEQTIRYMQGITTTKDEKK